MHWTTWPFREFAKGMSHCNFSLVKVKKLYWHLFFPPTFMAWYLEININLNLYDPYNCKQMIQIWWVDLVHDTSLPWSFVWAGTYNIQSRTTLKFLNLNCSFYKIIINLFYTSQPFVFKLLILYKRLSFFKFLSRFNLSLIVINFSPTIIYCLLNTYLIWNYYYHYYYNYYYLRLGN